jgi:stage II sporulation protein D
MPSIKKIIFTFLIVLITYKLIPAQDPPPDFVKHFKREVPIELYDGQQISIGVKGGEAVLECYRGVKLSEIYYFNSGVDLSYKENGIEIDDEDGALTIGLTEVHCKPRQDGALLTYGDHSYRGFLKAKYEDSPHGILLINVVDIEDYVKGVLPGEIGDRTQEEYEAVKAQAIAARTYAIWKLTDQGTSGKLASTIADQLYTGADSEKELLTKGVEDTQGEIMTYKNHPIAAYYHAVCGGHTAPIEKIWPEKKPIGYLEGVDDKDYCSWARSYSWSEHFTIAQLQDTLEKYFTDKGKCKEDGLGSIRNIEFERDKETGRIDVMKVTTPTGVYKEVADHIRWALLRPSVAGAILPSTKFSAEKEMDGDKIVGLKINGTGNGHGVGMCQCGAIGQSRIGQNYHDILKYYYKHIKIVKAY